MDHALPRRTAGTPRTWALCMTSENHGTVGKAGDPFSHAPGKHERLQVVEIVATGTPPAPDVDLAGMVRIDVADLVGKLDEVHTWARNLPIPTRGASSAMRKVSEVKDALATIPVAAQAGQVAVPGDKDAEIERLRTELEKMWKARFMLSQALHNTMVGNQSAWIEWQHGTGAKAAMEWIHNGLVGPGLIPDGKEAQPWYDANQDDRYDIPPCPALATPSPASESLRSPQEAAGTEKGAMDGAPTE